MKIGVICPSEIAYRRFMPALMKTDLFEYVGVAVASKEEWFLNDNDEADSEYDCIISPIRDKAKAFQDSYGGRIYDSYDGLIHSGDIDAIYIPLPPSMHYKWAMKALESNLNVFLEKPFTTNYIEAKNLVDIASGRGLALHENYMFAFHSQIEEIFNIVNSGRIGIPRLYRVEFGFPDRGKNDFRYDKKMGGGALLDCGGYTLKYANMLLHGNGRLVCANAQYRSDLEVDIFGSATMTNDDDQIVQVAFGMDNDYRCSINIWGSKGTLTSNRILTAPEGFVPQVELSTNGNLERFDLSSDDAFLKSIQHFYKCCNDNKAREAKYHEILKQERLIQDYMDISGITNEN